VVMFLKYSASYTWQPTGSSFVTYEQIIIHWLPNVAYLHHWDEWRIQYQNSQNYHSALNKGWRFNFFRASKSKTMGVCTPIHQQILKRSLKIVGTTPSFRKVKILKPLPSSPSFLIEMCQSFRSTPTPFLLT
jgi:hypothetical protein